MKRMLVLVATFSAFATLLAADYPGIAWEKHSRDGWSEPVFQAAREYTRSKKTAAVVIVQSGRVVDQWGEVGKKIEVRSIRKSFLNALYGIHVAERNIELGKTLGQLGIDDRPPALSVVEKQATILDLLRSRSGVYHVAARESPGMRALRPERGSHPAGAFYYYNNWDFNVLGAIFEKQTGKKIFEEFAERVAKPIRMEDYVATDGRFAGPEAASNVGGDSQYLNYVFSMTARDMARFGYLYLRNGRWGENQILPLGWVAQSTTTYSKFEARKFLHESTGYGLLWYTNDWGYSAQGAGGHWIAVIPTKDLVIVHRVAYDPPREDVVSDQDVYPLIRMVIDAAPTPKL